LCLHNIKFHHKLLVARGPMNHRVSQILLVLRFLLASLQVILCFLLLSMRKLRTLLNASAAHLQAAVNFLKRFRRGVKAMHRTPGRFKVHDVELLVEKGIEPNLSHCDSLVQIFNDFSLHIINGFLIRVQSEKLSHLVRGFVLGIEIHLCLLLKFLISFVFLLTPCFLLFVLEESWFGLLNFLFLNMPLVVKFFFQPALLTQLLLEEIKVREGCLLHRGLLFLPLLIPNFKCSLLGRSQHWRWHCLRHLFLSFWCFLSRLWLLSILAEIWFLSVLLLLLLL
jgi:hypothetical protein